MARKNRRGSRKLVLACMVAALAANAASANDHRKVKMRDTCNPESYDALFGPGVCVGNGTTTFFEFAAELRATLEVDSWRFNPEDNVHVEENGVLVIENLGGLLHTFTRVENFAGGFNAGFNNVMGLAPAPECAFIRPDGRLGVVPPNETHLFIAQGGVGTILTGEGTPLPVGVHHFQCCVHPWMKMSIEVREHPPGHAE